jgi:phosphoserine phosphatase
LSRLVICDLDGTLVSVSSEFVFVKGLLRRKVLTPAVLYDFFRHYLRHPVRTFTEGRGWNRGYFRGLPVSVMMEEAANDVPFLLTRVRPEVLRILREEEREGAVICILSASISPIVQGVARELGFHCFRGSIPAVKRGRLTGNLIGQRPWGRAKVAPALALMDQYGVNPEETLALGDSWSDRFVMGICGDAVAVDPGRKLRALAAERGWRVVAER